MFSEDTFGSVYDELKNIEGLILQSAQKIRDSKVADLKATYDLKKHQYLVELFAQESLDPKSKRTEKQREAMYRTKFEVERLSWVLSEREEAAEKDYLKALIAVQTSLQTRARLLQASMELS